jgi:hypothetical protein
MSKKRWMSAGVAASVVVLAVVLFWFQPQKLLIDETVNDELSTTDQATDQATGSPTAAEPIELASGTFISLDHSTSGAVRVLHLDDGTRIVRLEGLRTDNGPDLYLYLSRTAPDGEEGTFDDDFVSLGRLKGNRGDQNYELPSDVDLDRFGSVVIWCDRFNSAFGAASLVRT